MAQTASGGITMNIHDATEQAFKNGYKQGFEDGADRKQEEILNRLEE